MKKECSVGARIRLIRKRAGFTQQELGDLLGVSGSMIGQYESGTRNPKYETITRIAKALDGDINWLRNGNTSEEREEITKEEIQQMISKLNANGRKKVAEYAEVLILSSLFGREARN